MPLMLRWIIWALASLAMLFLVIGLVLVLTVSLVFIFLPIISIGLLIVLIIWLVFKKNRLVAGIKRKRAR